MNWESNITNGHSKLDPLLKGVRSRTGDHELERVGFTLVISTQGPPLVLVGITLVLSVLPRAPVDPCARITARLHPILATLDVDDPVLRLILRGAALDACL